MLKNVASQSIGAQMITAADGSAFTGSVTVSVTGDNGTQATGSVGSGACTHEGNGYHSYAPAQSETNYDHVAYTFTGSGAIPVTIQIYTDATYDRIGATGSGLTSLATAAALATVDSNVDAVLVDTGTTLPASLATIDGNVDAILVDTGTTLPGSIATIDGNVDAILVDTGTTIPAQISGLNDLSAAEVNAEVDTALADIHLDHLLAAEYDPASPPGASTALLNELVESDAGVSRFTANALENAPTGGSAPTAADIRAEIDSNSTQLAAILADTNELQADDIPTLIAALPTAAAIADAVLDEAVSGHTTTGTVGALLNDTTAPAKGVALNNVVFYMVDANDHITAETGLSSITAEISQDGGAFATCTNSVAEISDGYYQINLTATEMDADLITLRFAHANADEVGYTFQTQEV